jgi:NDP-sugar pyrophosphorylase family protein
MSLPGALVLTAGLGTRLRPLTYVRAKAAVPVNGQTLARRIVRWLAGQGVRDQVLNLHHLPETITASVGDGSDLGARVRYSWEQPVLGSAGGPRRALPLLAGSNPPPPRVHGSARFGAAAPTLVVSPDRTTSDGGRVPGSEPDGTFIIVNGDTLTDVDVPAMLAFHAASEALVTMALIPNPRPQQYGGVRASGGRVIGFTRAGAPGDSYHFIGVQIVEARAFAGLEDGVPAETVNVLYPRLIAAGAGSVAAYTCTAAFRDIGTASDYLSTSAELAAIEGDHMISGRRVEIASSARTVRTAVWDDVSIGRDVELDECIVGDGARIPDGARYTRCAIVPADGRAARAGERIECGLLIKPID